MYQSYDGEFCLKVSQHCCFLENLQNEILNNFHRHTHTHTGAISMQNNKLIKMIIDNK